MTPTLNGRLQTKFFLLAVIGPIWNAFLVLFFDGSWFENWLATLQVLAWTFVLGILWELLWHAIQQTRWEKDWPIMYGLLQYIPEGVLVWFVTSQTGLGLIAGSGMGDSAESGVATGPFLWSFITTVIVTWIWANGPQRVFFIKWRFEGGRLV